MSGTVVVGVSGGVDSAVSALLLKQQGHDVQAVFMDNWDAEDSYCTAAEDFQDARAVCARLDIPLHRVSFAAEYLERVFSHFLAEYAAGRTPNPDVLCNSEIKFRAFLDHALRLGATHIATGHYAARGPDAAPLVLATDAGKDQTYFLHAVAPEALRRSLFPLGGLHKREVRELARTHALPVHDKPDSTGICFIGERRFREFLARYLPAQPGPIITLEGQVLGEHPGLMYFTIGQREGLGIGGQRGADEAPWYVADKRVATRELVVVQGHDHPALLARTLEAGASHWLAPAPLPGEQLQARTRHRQALQACTIEALNADSFRVRFDLPQRALTPGQYCVLYRGEVCVGGGVIRGSRTA